ncbi:MAG: hypothetical protein LBG98_02510 [Puniceicoccales bacterium]|jgi:4-diphosphocytidyl-2-C-methyl-D-erythritol kinase|nr:hypothetical protein [Puniceicoccales bacterium]
MQTSKRNWVAEGQNYRAPSKINLFLAIHERDALRKLHRLTSFLLPLDLCDELFISRQGNVDLDITRARAIPLGRVSFTIDVRGHEASLISDQILSKVFQLWSRKYSLAEDYKIRLLKNIPLKAGLGGGSSDAAVLLRFLRDVQQPSPHYDDLISLALACGSDVPFFLRPEPSVVRGFGEEIERLGTFYPGKNQSQTWLLFKPAYAVATADAYGCLRERASEFSLPESESQKRLDESLQSFAEKNPKDWRFYNSFQKLFVERFPPISPLLHALKAMHYSYGMSGSGSTWFVPLEMGDDGGDVVRQVRDHLGPGVWIAKASGWSSM